MPTVAIKPLQRLYSACLSEITTVIFGLAASKIRQRLSRTPQQLCLESSAAFRCQAGEQGARRGVKKRMWANREEAEGQIFTFVL